MRDYVIFTHGVYKTGHLDFYRKLCRSKIKVAVDGGMSFFLKSNVTPDFLIGDLDSLKKMPKDLSRMTKVITFPIKKDKTDLHLAFEYCFSKQAESIDVVLPSFGQPDHFLGNVMLVNLVDKREHTASSPRIRFVNVRYEIIFVADRTETFVNCPGHLVSVIPLSNSIVLTCSGTEYDVSNLRIRSGDSRASRNRIASRRATFDIKGRAFIIHHFSR